MKTKSTRSVSRTRRDRIEREAAVGISSAVAGAVVGASAGPPAAVIGAVLGGVCGNHGGRST
jgi:phage tail tape-measure protein